MGGEADESLDEAVWAASIRAALGPREARDKRVPAASRFDVRGEMSRDETSVLLRGVDRELDRDVALRVLEPRVEGARRFLEEAQVAAQLQHPAILPVYALGTLPDGRAFVAQRLVEGTTLADLVARDANPRRRLAILEQAALAVAFAHARGVAHGHLDATRIVVGAHGEVLVTGWDRAVRTNGNPGPAREDARILAALAREVGVADDAGPPRAAGVARAIRDRLASEERRAREAEVEAARERGRTAVEQARARTERCRESLERRARARTTLVAAGVLVAVLAGVAGGLWRVGEDWNAAANVEAEVAAALRQARRAVAVADWGTARSWVVKAIAIGGRAEDLLAEVEEGERAAAEHRRLVAEDRALLERLDEIRWLSFEYDPALAAGEYAAAFATLGLRPESQSVVEGAAVLRRRPLLEYLVPHLDHWFAFDEDVATGLRLMEIVDRVDPSEPRRRVRRAYHEGRNDEVRRLAEGLDCREFARSTPLTVAQMLAATGNIRTTRGLLEELARRHPGSAEIRLLLAGGLSRRFPWAVSAGRAQAAAAVALRPRSAAAHLSLGWWLNRRPDEALRVLRRAVTLSPEWAVARSNLAVSLLHVGRFEEAQAEVERAIALDPGNAPSRFNLGEIRLALGDPGGALEAYAEAARQGLDSAALHAETGVARQTLDDAEGAEAAYRRALAIDPAHGAALASMRDLLLASGRSGEAEAVCRRARDHAPNDPGPRRLLGFVLELEQKDEEAEREYRAATELDPDDPFGALCLGAFLTRRGRAAEGLPVLEAAVRRHPEQADLRGELGLCLRELGRIDRAEREIRRALELRPGLAGTHNWLGSLLFNDRQDFRGAEKAFREAVRLDPRRPLFRSNLGNALFALRRLDEAAAAYRKALEFLGDGAAPGRRGTANGIRSAPPVALSARRRRWNLSMDPPRAEMAARAHDSLGSILMWQGGDPAAALELFDRTVELVPDLAPYHVHRAGALMRLGRGEEAETALRAAIAIAPGDPVPHGVLAELLLAMGEIERAGTHFREAIRLGSSSPVNHARLGLVLNFQGDEPGAIAALREAVCRGWSESSALNTLAWLLVTCRDETLRAPEEAVELARRVCDATPDAAGVLNTLGVALYRAGRHEEAIHALAASRKHGGAEACDDLVLAMAHWRLGRKAEARRLLARGTARLESHPIEDERAASDTNRFRAEAEALIERKPGGR